MLATARGDDDEPVMPSPKNTYTRPTSGHVKNSGHPPNPSASAKFGAPMIRSGLPPPLTSPWATAEPAA